jgi:hypothetical protein
LNHKIQDILEYKDYTNIARLFHFACKAERDVQGRHASMKTNFSTGRPWQFDKDHMHHGQLNQYSFLHHDMKIVLHPMSPEAMMHNDVAAARKPNLMTMLKLQTTLLLRTV